VGCQSHKKSILSAFEPIAQRLLPVKAANYPM